LSPRPDPHPPRWRADADGGIRPAHLRDIPAVQDIERRAGHVFATVGIDAIASDDPPSTADLTGYVRAERAWVAVDGGDAPIGYVLVDVIDDHAHIEQVTVAPEHARRGLGAALIQQVEVWARAHDLAGLTLTTFRDVPWNAPYYGRLGFEPIAVETLSGGLRDVRAREAAAGLDRWPRTAMRRPF
jgi:GNAT superfamily N-acetyltransferase